ncbi:dihydropteroate synthase [Desulfobotulus sp. H1]|uniref:Dihydropteroate synthase n=1 Tax=Desulfobotulus pelophilus TaxID=2823377 RepID=A0ABT3N513_9BACT|nr:dihydropteroate synthase [Desulfobotulus pelophilus]MCW7752534.1 dihydropteroate synthase [Desulfobotulus pelophilus]
MTNRIPDPDSARLILPDQCTLMGIVNCTPDSFSDGGRFLALEKALDHARRLMDEGAGILDIGGESTRPFASPVSSEEECRRVIPLLRELRKESTIPLSIDTRKASVAKAAIEAGIDMVNDISALADPDMLSLCAEAGVHVVLMHMQNDPQTMQIAPQYKHVVKEVKNFLRIKVELAVKGGIAADRILIDPGIGFGKTLEDNLKLMAHLNDLKELGCPLLLGTSRKRFIRTITARNGREPDTLSPEVLAGTLTTAILGVQSGAKVLRVHDVAATRAALEVNRAITLAGQPCERNAGILPADLS